MKKILGYYDGERKGIMAGYLVIKWVINVTWLLEKNVLEGSVYGH